MLRQGLLNAIKENRDRHRDIFLKAQEGYRIQLIKELDQMLADARDGKKLRRFVTLPEPEDHTDDYDRVIKMLEMSVEEQLEIDETQFAMYVMDDWGWKKNWTTTNAAYIAQ